MHRKRAPYMLCRRQRGDVHNEYGRRRRRTRRMWIILFVRVIPCQNTPYHTCPRVTHLVFNLVKRFSSRTFLEPRSLARIFGCGCWLPFDHLPIIPCDRLLALSLAIDPWFQQCWSVLVHRAYFLEKGAHATIPVLVRNRVIYNPEIASRWVFRRRGWPRRRRWKRIRFRGWRWG